MPNLYIISGCKGAGKTTASFTILPEILNCREFVNADEIARGLSPFEPESVGIEAGRIMLTRIDELISQQKDFAFETTLSTRSFVSTVKKAQEQGYYVTLLFLWLDSVEQAIDRVKSRVADGGHNIPEEIIRRRYYKGLENLFELYMPVCNSWITIDNSQSPYEVIAELSDTNGARIFNQLKWKTIYERGNKER